MKPVRRIDWRAIEAAAPEEIHRYEWLVTNGLGGYASGTISGVMTRRYHGLLIAAMPVPLGRMVMLSSLAEEVRLPDGSTHRLLSFQAQPQDEHPHLLEFRLESGLPVWRYDLEGFVVEKRLMLPYGQNTVHLNYRLLAGEGKVRLRLRPALNFRHHETAVDAPLSRPYLLKALEDRYELFTGHELPPLRLRLYGERGAFTVEGYELCQVFYDVEKSRGYACAGDLWSPGFFRADLAEDRPVTLVASTEKWETVLALSPEEALQAELGRRERLLAGAPNVRESNGAGAELLLAADQFIITPAGRVEDAARARAAGDEVRSVIAGYHWFTDWGRDTMISLEGLTLLTGRHQEAGYILRTFANYVRDGLLPNMFPEADRQGLYHTADATLWFFHAIDRYLAITRDELTLRKILPILIEIIDRHVRGTRFGIGMDHADGLLRQGEVGYALTWMDAKVGDWVVTPRRGKAVEINALWYNALRLLEKWIAREIGEKQSLFYAEMAARAKDSFNRSFWYEKGGHLYDVVDGENGDDAACRPNQVLAVSLRYPVLDCERWEPVIGTVQERLLTPVGLRSLAPGHPDYKDRYFGDLRARDAAYHQGTVWGWLIGPFIDAWLKLYPDRIEEARGFLAGFEPHLSEAGIGTISEIFDAEPPFTPRGCIAQAWSVAEVLRCRFKLATHGRLASAQGGKVPSEAGVS